MSVLDRRRVRSISGPENARLVLSSMVTRGLIASWLVGDGPTYTLVHNDGSRSEPLSATEVLDVACSAR